MTVESDLVRRIQAYGELARTDRKAFADPTRAREAVVLYGQLLSRGYCPTPRDVDRVFGWSAIAERGVSKTEAFCRLWVDYGRADEEHGFSQARAKKFIEDVLSEIEK